jgi:lysophospholipase L1-like esterase
LAFSASIPWESLQAAAEKSSLQTKADSMISAIDQRMLDHLVTTWDATGRVRAVLNRATHQDSFVVGFIGGSITQGDGPGRYSTLVTRWLRSRSPGIVKELNAGIGGTGSDFASYRVSKDLLDGKPDLVFVEFSVNDGDNPGATASMEALVRQILSRPDAPAVIMIGMLKEDGTNAQKAHVPVAKHYGIPYLSVRDSIWPALQAGGLNWKDLYRDNIHPGDQGHALVAALITRYLDTLNHAPVPAAASRPLPLPPLLSPSAKDFAQTALTNAVMTAHQPIRLVSNEGWSVLQKSRHGPAWESTTPGDEIVFQFEGNAAAVLVHRAIEGMGEIEVAIDGGTFQRFNLLIPHKLMDNSCLFPVASGLRDGKHTLVVRHAVSSAHNTVQTRVELRMVLTAARSKQP